MGETLDFIEDNRNNPEFCFGIDSEEYIYVDMDSLKRKMKRQKNEKTNKS